VSFPERLPTLRDASSDRSSSEYFGEDGSMDGNPRSRQSSVSLPRRPSSGFRHHDTMGFDSMVDKPFGRHSWSSSRHSIGPPHRSHSPVPPIPPMPRSTTPTSSTISRRSTIYRGSGDYTMDPDPSPRLSTESNSSRDWQNPHMNRSSLDSEFDQRRELPAPIDRNVSGKRRAEPRRGLHRAAVSRRQSIRLVSQT